MVSDLLHGLVRELAEEFVARLLQPLKQHVLPGRVEQVPGDRLREIPVWLFDKQAIAEVENVAVKSELVAVPRFIQQQRRLANQIEREVGKADVDLEHRSVPAPLADPLAQHEGIIAEAEQVFAAGRELFPIGGRSPGARKRCCRSTLDPGLRRGTRRHMCFTSSGMS